MKKGCFLVMLTNWWTTLVGFIGGAALYLLQAGVKFPETKQDWYAFALAVVIGGLGLTAKSATTGSTPKMLLFAVLLGAGLWASPAHAEPTPVNRLLLWDYTGPAIDGFYVYLAPEAEAPRVYSDARRVEVADPAARQVVVLDVNPTATNRICFRVTAYVGPTESDYSGEACGFFGIPGATNARVQ